MIRKARVTSVDVAKRAGVSASAVSRTFTPGASVAKDTREKVLRAAHELGYRPNAIARSLITSRSNIIGVVMAALDNQYHPQFLERLSDELQKRGYQILLFRGPDEGHADVAVETILQYQVDGLILASATLSSEFAEKCVAAGAPVVLFNRTPHRGVCSSVTSDNVAGGQRIAEFLLAGGHKRFAFVAGGANSSTNRDRERGYMRALNDAGISNVLRAVGNYSFEGAREAARELFSAVVRPDAIFVANDHMAFAVMDEARYRFGLAIPDDVSIVGYNDSRVSSWESYSLTTLEQPVDALVDATVDVLINQIQSRSQSRRRIQVAGNLIVRRSAKLPPRGIVHAGAYQIWIPERADPSAPLTAADKRDKAWARV
jgi:DNA-binding LacI/PurR family transcriptional regulator